MSRARRGTGEQAGDSFACLRSSPANVKSRRSPQVMTVSCPARQRHPGVRRRRHATKAERSDIFRYQESEKICSYISHLTTW
jgi:hypothetical protein